jgi:hypothetical protein
MTSERPLPDRESSSGPAALGSIFDAPEPPGQVTVSTGLHHSSLPVANLTVGEIRARFRDRFQIPPQSQATLDGRTVDDQTVVRSGQLLRFQHTAGERGRP